MLGFSVLLFLCIFVGCYVCLGCEYVFWLEGILIVCVVVCVKFGWWCLF